MEIIATELPNIPFIIKFKFPSSMSSVLIGLSLVAITIRLNDDDVSNQYSFNPLAFKSSIVW